MKASKIFAIALAALTMSACSEDGDFPTNTQDATVTVAETQITVLENVGIFNVPLVVTGDLDGYVEVEIECVEVGDNPAIANANYYLTSNKVRINAEDKVGNIEFRSIDYRGENPTVTFAVKIKSANGAKIGTPAETYVSIEDKGTSPKYEDLAGDWFMTGLQLNVNTGNLDDEFLVQVTMTARDSEKKAVYLNGCPTPYGNVNMLLYWDWYEEENWGQLVLPFGERSGSFSGYSVKWCNTMPPYGQLEGKWNSSYTSVTFGGETDRMIYCYLYDGDNPYTYITVYQGFTISKIEE